MTNDKPIGLLIGMVFIIAFGLILSQVTGTRSLHGMREVLSNALSHARGIDPDHPRFLKKVTQTF